MAKGATAPAPDRRGTAGEWEPGRAALRDAWLGVALLPISAFLAFMVALLLSAAFSPSFLGTDSSTAGIPDPVWLGPLTVVLAGAVFLLPALLAVGMGARASRHGRRGWIPAVTAVLLVAVVVWLIVLSVVLGP